MELLAGALLERPPGPKYTSKLRFAELAPQAPLPKPGTLAKWRQKLPDEFELALRAPDVSWQSPAGPLRPSRELDAGLAWLSEAADALQTSMIVVSTSAAVTTGARDRERLREYFGRIPRAEGRLIAWRPTGLWEPDTVRTMASALSVVGGFDAAARLIRTAKDNNIMSVLSSSFESGAGIRSIALFAAKMGLANISAGLDTLKWLGDDVLKEKIKINNGSIDVLKLLQPSLRTDTLTKI